MIMEEERYMSKQDDSSDNLLYGNVFKTMLSLSVPAILGMVVIGLYSFSFRDTMGKQQNKQKMHKTVAKILK